MSGGNLDTATSWQYTQRIVGTARRFSALERRAMSGRRLCHVLGEAVHRVAGQVFRTWHFLLSLVPLCKRLLTARLKRESERHFVESWGACIFREMISRKVSSQSTPNQLEPPLQDEVQTGSHFSGCGISSTRQSRCASRDASLPL